MDMSSLRRVLQQRYSPRMARCVSRFILVLATALSTGAVAAQVPSPSSGEVQTLTPNASETRRIQTGQTRAYQLKLRQHEFARITVDQRGVDLKLTVTAPAKSSSIQVDSPNGFFGLETVSLLAPVEGTYRVEVAFASSAQYPPGDYFLQLDGPRSPTIVDEICVSAEKVFAEAQQMRSSNNPAEAIDKYNEALRLWREVGDLRQQGYALTNIGRAHTLLRQLAPALENLSQAINILRQANDFPGQALALNEAGAAQRELGDMGKAVELYRDALKLRIDFGDRYGEAQLYNNLGLTYSYMGYQPRALEFYEKALASWRELRVRHEEMRAIINVAKAEAEMGDLQLARLHYQTGLNYCIAELKNKYSSLVANARKLKPYAVNGLGLVADTSADTDLALGYYNEALELFRENKELSEEANVLDNLGLTYAFLNDPNQAIEYFQQALTIRKRLNKPRPWGMTLSNLGYAYTLLENYDEAKKQLTLALPLSAQARDRRFEAYTLLRLGMTYIAPSNPEPLKALEHYEKALAIQQEPGFEDRRGQAMTLDKIAETLARSGHEDQALKKYEDAIELWRAVGDEQGEALSLYGIARIERDRTNIANARDRIEKAIGIVERLRHKVTARQLQMTYFAEKQDFYALAIDVRMQLYEAKKSPADLEAALAFSEKARARNLLDLLSEAQADPHKDMPPELAKTNRRLEQQISQLKQSLLRFRGVDAKEEAAGVQRILDARLKDHDHLLDSLKNTSAPTFQSQPLTPPQIQQLLDDNTVLLQYSLDKKRSHLWKVTRGEIKYFALAERAEIEAAANQFRRVLVDLEPQRENEPDPEAARKRHQAARVNYGPSAANLSRLILHQVAPELGNKRLVIVADGTLQSIPFDALPVPESVITSAHHASNNAQRSLLLASNEIVYQPSASALAMLRRIPRPDARKTVAVIADPVFNNKLRHGKVSRQPAHPAKVKLTRSLRDIGDSGDFTLQPLEFSRKEAKAITAVAPRGTSMIAVGFEANRALATSPILKQFSIVHFATHGILNDKNPELSGLVLSMFNKRGQPQDGYLILRDIYKLDLPVQLVVVSACETGVGKSVRGEGLIALTRGFMNAGAQSVVVSLWRVEDEATAELMKRFYTHMFGKNAMSPAAALRQAKLEMKDNYHPYHWAGFVLQGDWK